MDEVEKSSQPEGDEQPTEVGAPPSSRKLRPPRPVSGSTHAAVKPPSVRKVGAGRGSSPKIGRSPSNPQLGETSGAERAPLSSSDLIEVPPAEAAAAVPEAPSSDPTTFKGSERSLVIDLPAARSERPTMPAVTPSEVVRLSERSIEARAESLSAPVDSTSAMTASVEPAAPFVSELATPTTPQDETFIVRRKVARKTIPVSVAALVVGAAAAFFAVDGSSVARDFIKGPQANKAPTAVPSQPVVASPPVVPVPVPVPERSATPAPSAVAPTAPPANPDVPEGKGALKTETAKSGRRIFVDGRVVGQTPATVVVPCGIHDVKIGSSGRASSIEIPCQGEISLGDW